jgi:hypothetical protein
MVTFVVRLPPSYQARYYTQNQAALHQVVLLTLGFELMLLFYETLKLIVGIAAICGCIAATSLSAATLPAGTSISIKTNSQISERDPVGRTFTGQVDQDVVVNGATVLKAGTLVTGRVTASRASSRPGRGSAPLSVALTSIKANGSNVAVNTAPVQPQGATTAQTARTRSRGVSAGNILVTPGTTMQFVLSQAFTI